jgi:hypothetical protein
MIPIYDTTIISIVSYISILACIECMISISDTTIISIVSYISILACIEGMINTYDNSTMDSLRVSAIDDV